MLDALHGVGPLYAALERGVRRCQLADQFRHAGATLGASHGNPPAILHLQGLSRLRDGVAVAVHDGRGFDRSQHFPVHARAGEALEHPGNLGNRLARHHAVNVAELVGVFRHEVTQDEPLALAVEVATVDERLPLHIGLHQCLGRLLPQLGDFVQGFAAVFAERDHIGHCVRAGRAEHGIRQSVRPQELGHVAGLHAQLFFLAALAGNAPGRRDEHSQAAGLQLLKRPQDEIVL